jgi:hypothetical protein
MLNYSSRKSFRLKCVADVFPAGSPANSPIGQAVMNTVMPGVGTAAKQINQNFGKDELALDQQPNPANEHLENIGGPKVTIEPAFQSMIQNAVNFVNNKYPDLLRDVTDVFGHVEDGGVFGEFKTTKPHSIFINIRDIESKVRQVLQGHDENAIKKEIENQIIKTLIHESTHRKEFGDTGYSTESGPEQAEKAVEPFLEQISNREGLNIITSRA